MDLTEAEDTKKRWQEYTEELYKKDLHDQDNHDSVVTHLKPDIGEGSGTPLQYSCLENPLDGGAWWAAIYGVAESRARLKRLSNSSSSHLFLISFASIAISVLYCACLCMKYFLNISAFLEEFSSLSHSIVFFYFFALFT